MNLDILGMQRVVYRIAHFTLPHPRIAPNRQRQRRLHRLFLLGWSRPALFMRRLRIAVECEPPLGFADRRRVVLVIVEKCLVGGGGVL